MIVAGIKVKDPSPTITTLDQALEEGIEQAHALLEDIQKLRATLINILCSDQYFLPWEK